MKALTPKESLFVEAYCTVAKFNATKAYQSAGYSDLKHASSRGSAMLRKPHVKAAIEKRIEEKKRGFAVTHEDVLRGIYNEATRFEDDASSSSRINAWVWLGKEIDMFKPKQDKEDTLIQVNVVSYGAAEVQGRVIETAKALPVEEVKQIEQSVVEVIDYSVEEKGNE